VETAGLERFVRRRQIPCHLHDSETNERYGELISAAAFKRFGIDSVPKPSEGPAAYLVGEHTLRVVYNELVVRFEDSIGPTARQEILERAGFRVVAPCPFTRNQWVVRHVNPSTVGQQLLRTADMLGREAAVTFAWPRSVAEYRRASSPAPKALRWWLDAIDVNWSTGTRRLVRGDPTIVVAVLDDGVDIDHPSLASRVAQELCRNYVVADTDQEFGNPRPKVQVASDADSDYHGTLCAGLVCADGSKKKFLGVAPGCTLLALRVIGGPDLVDEPRLAAAIRYATGVADVLSCSWGAGNGDHTDVVAALNETTQGRKGKGTAVFCAVGNDGTTVDFPARHSQVMAVGACDEEGEETDYANFGPELDFVAPSSNDDRMVYSTDVSGSGWGFNKTGGAAGLFYEKFGETSAATAIAAGVGALCLSANPGLTANQLRVLLQDTADKIGTPDPDGPPLYDPQTGHGNVFGYGRINAANAVAAANSPPPPAPA